MKTFLALLLAALALVPSAAPAIQHAVTPVNAANRDELIEQGTFIRIRMLTQLSSAYSKPGDVFSWVVSDDITVGNRVVIPAGTVGYGRVRQVSPAHGGGTPGFLRLQFYSIVLTDSTRVEVAVTRASAVLDQNEKNGYAPAADEVASVVVPYFFLFDALRKGEDMTIRQNAVFHIAVIEDAFATKGAVATSATPPPPPAPPVTPAASAVPASSAPSASAVPASAAPASPAPNASVAPSVAAPVASASPAAPNQPSPNPSN